MKKLSAIFIALVLVAVTAVTAFAAGINSSEQAVIDKLGEPIAMKNGNMTFPSDFINQMENYFNTIDMTEDESAQIIAYLEDGQTFLEGTGAANIDDLTFDQKQELLSYGQNVVGVIGMTMSYDKTTRLLTIVDPNGNVAFSSKPTLVAEGTSSASGNNGVIKTTGAVADFGGFIALGAVAVVLLAGGALYLVRSKKEA